MAANPPKGAKGTLQRGADGVAIHHVHFTVSLYAEHGGVLVSKSDPRGDGRPPRPLASVRIPLGFRDLVGLPSMDASLTIARSIVEALARGTDAPRPEAPAPPEGVTGAALDPLRTDTIPGT